MRKTMNRIGILTAGGDTPALNATLYGAVERANQCEVEVFGLIKGFDGLLNPSVPHVLLNPLYQTIPELDPCLGGSIVGSSRTYIDPQKPAEIKAVTERLKRLGIEGLICIGGDGTISGMQPVSEFFPCTLAPKTIDNDLGLNYIDEPSEWQRDDSDSSGKLTYRRAAGHDELALEEIINYATPGYATAVFVVVQAVERIRTTAETHRRIAIIEVMGRESGYIALGSAYGQPDLVLLPEVPLNIDRVEQRVREIYDHQKHAVVVIGEGVTDETGLPLGAIDSHSKDPAGNILFSGAAEALESLLLKRLGDSFFQRKRRHESAKAAIFTRKVGHTQRGGRPIQFDRFYASQLGGKAFDLLLAEQNDTVATLQWSREQGFRLDALAANKLKDQWGMIHPRFVHRSFYDALKFQPSKLGVEYLRSIFTHAIGQDDVEVIRAKLFSPGNLVTRYQSVNVDIQKRIRYLDKSAS
ncbi:MAG TPA: 6-phosphofructokinase [Planctomycetaceae bacterium]|nr:6-phosphofructokinase [Planctomycetaceae bacterium]